MTTVPPEFPMPRSHPLDPPPLYRELGAEQPVFQARTPRGDTTWVVTRHEDARAVLTDHVFSSDPRTPGFPTFITGDVPPTPGFFMLADPPDHGRLRRSVTREFLINQMEALRPTMRRILDGLIDDFTATGGASAGTSAAAAGGADTGRTVDLVRQFALPMAAMTICEILGVPFEDHELFVSLTDIVLDRTSSPEQAVKASTQLGEYFDRLVTAKEAKPSEDMFGRMVTRSAEGGLTHEELIGMAALLLLAGYDTVAQVIGLGVLTFCENPDQLAEVKKDPALLPTAVDELLRYLSIHHAGLPRAVTDDVMVGGKQLRAGDGVLVMLNAVNRDEKVFDNPDAFDIHRENAGQHLAFGHGFHKCVGATLARVELAEVFGGLFERLPELRPARPMKELSFRDDMVLYGLRELPVTW